MILRSVLILAALAVAAPAFAAGPEGEWLHADGRSKVRIAHCGAALCGTLSWVKEASMPGKVGQKVFFDMKPAGDNAWKGSAFNPEDGKTYAGKMTLNGDSLNTAGCVFGGMICKSVDWSRVH